MRKSEEKLETFDVDQISLAPLLYQAGYLTIAGITPEGSYQLDYPNLEVKISFQKYLLEVFAHIPPDTDEKRLSFELEHAFKSYNMNEMVSVLHQLFAHVPYSIQDPQEKYYHDLVQMALTGAHIEAHSDYLTDHGRIDIVAQVPDYLYIIEIKFNIAPKKALEQIHQRRYYDRFLYEKKPIVLLDLSFYRSPSTFNITYATKILNPTKEI